MSPLSDLGDVPAEAVLAPTTAEPPAQVTPGTRHLVAATRDVPRAVEVGGDDGEALVAVLQPGGHHGDESRAEVAGPVVGGVVEAEVGVVDLHLRTSPGRD